MSARYHPWPPRTSETDHSQAVGRCRLNPRFGPVLVVALAALAVSMATTPHARGQEPAAPPAAGDTVPASGTRDAKSFEEQLLLTEEDDERLLAAVELFGLGEYERLGRWLVSPAMRDEIKHAILRGVALAQHKEPNAAFELLWPIATGSERRLADLAIDGLGRVNSQRVYQRIHKAIVEQPGTRHEVEVATQILSGKDRRRATELLVDALERHHDASGELGRLIVRQLHDLTGATLTSAKEWRDWYTAWQDRSIEDWLLFRINALQDQVRAREEQALSLFRENISLLKEQWRAGADSASPPVALIDSLAGALEISDAPLIALEAVRELGTLGSEDRAVELLLGLLGNDVDRELRRAAIDGLGKSQARRQEVIAQLLPLVETSSDASPALGLAAIETMSQLAERSTATPLNQALARSLEAEQTDRALALVQALGSVASDPDGQVSRTLRGILTASDDAAEEAAPLLEAAVVALGQLAYAGNSPEADSVVAALEPYTHSPRASEELRWQAVASLGHVPHARAITVVLSVLDQDETSTVKKAAIGSLGSLGASVARPDDLTPLFSSLARYLNGGAQDLRGQTTAALKRILLADPTGFGAQLALLDALEQAGHPNEAAEFLRLLPESAARLDEQQRADAQRWFMLKQRQAEILIELKQWKEAANASSALSEGLSGPLAPEDSAASAAYAGLLLTETRLGLAEPVAAAEMLVEILSSIAETRRERMWQVVSVTAQRLAARKLSKEVSALATPATEQADLPPDLAEQLDTLTAETAPGERAATPAVNGGTDAPAPDEKPEPGGANPEPQKAEPGSGDGSKPPGGPPKPDDSLERP